MQHFGRLRQEDRKFQPSLGNLTRARLKIKRARNVVQYTGLGFNLRAEKEREENEEEEEKKIKEENILIF